MKQIIFPTDPEIKIETSRLAADAAAGSSVTLTLDDNDGLTNTDFIAVGYEGAELCELEQINAAVSGATGGTYTSDATNDYWTFTSTGTWTPTITPTSPAQSATQMMMGSSF